MNNLHKLVYLLLITFCWSCNHDSKTEKYQNKRDNVVNVRDKVKEIKIEDVLIGRFAQLYPMGDYLIISDYRSLEKLIHLFDKKTFNYVTSTANRGQGPGEITNIGHIGIDNANRIFYVSDHGKQAIFSYDLDSVIANSFYLPKEKIKMKNSLFPDRYQYINDTLCIGLIIEPIGNVDFKQSVGKWNMNTGEIKIMKYDHPDIEKKRIAFSVSMENGIYVESNFTNDLMTICSLNGDLKYNVYGPDWNCRRSYPIQYYGRVKFCNDRIVAAYSGGNYNTDERHPTKFLVFDIDGNYIQTLETGYRIYDFCYDKENNRIIMSLDDEIQFAYLDLDGLIE